MPRRRNERVNGPYKHRRRWRVNHVNREGVVTAHYFEGEGEAEAFIKLARKQIADESSTVTVGDVITEYLDHCRTKGNRGRPASERSLKTTGYRLRSLLPEDLPITQLTRRKAQALYNSMVSAKKTVKNGDGTREVPRYSTDTHRNTLGQAKTFARWAVKKGYWRTSPLEEIEGVGRRQTGKEQLNADEARAFAEFCLDSAATDEAAVAALLCLLVGLRATQAVSLEVRDVAADGSWVYIGKRTRKSRAGEGRREVPDVLAIHLARLRRGSKRAVFSGDRHWLYREVRKLCDRAGVPRVPPHGLRGTHVTLAAEAGVTGHVVAANLGHSSYEGVTVRHYARAQAVAGAKTRRVLEVINGGKSG